LDLIIVFWALLLLLPLLLVVAAAIKLSDGGPIFFRHKRIGRDGVQFECLKFRTMVTNSDDILRQHLAENTEAAREWEETHKIKSDPRITALGLCLRKTSVDELPQLINVLKGEMSLVGPRPIVAAEVPKYGECIEQYLRARPGLTGLWQVSGRNDTDYASRVMLDRNYVQDWSLWRDLVIITKTFRVVLNGRGCY